MTGRPPIPEPILTPMRSAFSGVTCSPESRSAWIPAAMPKWINVSMRRASFADMYCVTSNPLTSPAICAEKAAGSKCVMREIPGLPARMLDQASVTVLPTGLMIPRPVMTTRRRDNAAPLCVDCVDQRLSALLRVADDVIDRLLHCRNLLGFLIRDLHLEFLLEGHHQLDRVERVGAEVIDEGRFVLGLGLVDAQLLGNDFLDALFYVFHI